jgi:hypothetical protein
MAYKSNILALHICTLQAEEKRLRERYVMCFKMTFKMSFSEDVETIKTKGAGDYVI